MHIQIGEQFESKLREGSSISFHSQRSEINASQVRRLDVSPNYVIKYNINSARKNGYLPISLEKLKAENPYLYNLLAKS